MADAAYIPRILDNVLTDVLKWHPAVIITGPRGVGKTSTGSAHANSRLLLDDPGDLTLVETDPTGAVTNEPPLLIDEWQIQPEVLWAVKRKIDGERGAGRYIITGSTRNDLFTDQWPLTGRAIHLRMRGLVGREVYGSATAVSLFDRWDDEEARFSLPDPVPTLREYLQIALAGGLPDVAAIDDDRQRRRRLKSYVDMIVSRDLPLYDAPRGRNREPRRFGQYLKSYALNTAGVVPHQTIMRPINGLGTPTANGYLEVLTDMGIVDEVPPWSGSPGRRLMTEQAKRYFVDPGLAAAAVGLSADDIYRNDDLLGRFIDTFIAAQLRVEADVSEADVSLYHLRVRNGQREIDMVAERGQKLIAFEFKAGREPDRHDARHLLWFRDEVAGERFDGAVVFHAGRNQYRIYEGIYAVPIAGLWGPGLPEMDQPALPLESQA